MLWAYCIRAFFCSGMRRSCCSLLKWLNVLCIACRCLQSLVVCTGVDCDCMLTCCGDVVMCGGNRARMEGKISPVVAVSAFSKDLKRVAIAPNTEDVHIFDTKGSDDVNKWDKKYTLKEVPPTTTTTLALPVLTHTHSS